MNAGIQLSEALFLFDEVLSQQLDRSLLHQDGLYQTLIPCADGTKEVYVWCIRIELCYTILQHILIS